jgi:hypothetical protein
MLGCGSVRSKGEIKMAKKQTTALAEDQVSNGAEDTIEMTLPYLVDVTIVGVAPLLYHAWNTESVDAKAAAAKGSKAKKSDDVESYVYRTEDGYLGVAGKCFYGALCEAARFSQDPRSPRKSARDLVKAAVQVLTLVAPLEPKRKNWDYDDKQRVVIQRSAITRVRPALKEGWKVTFQLAVNLPEYITPGFLYELIKRAGQFTALCDYRPTYGRFRIEKFNIVQLD